MSWAPIWRSKMKIYLAWSLNLVKIQFFSTSGQWRGAEKFAFGTFRCPRHWFEGSKLAGSFILYKGRIFWHSGQQGGTKNAFVWLNDAFGRQCEGLKWSLYQLESWFWSKSDFPGPITASASRIWRFSIKFLLSSTCHSNKQSNLTFPHNLPLPHRTQPSRKPKAIKISNFALKHLGFGGFCFKCCKSKVTALEWTRRLKCAPFAVDKGTVWAIFDKKKFFFCSIDKIFSKVAQNR